MMDTLKNQVEHILETNPATRNSDITLMIYIWRTFHSRYIVDDTIKLDSLYELPREDNIKRIRATFQNEEGKYLPSDPEIRRKRGIREEQWRAFLGYSVKNTSPEAQNEPTSVKKLTWQETYRRENEKARIAKMRRDDIGRIIACE